MNNSLLIIKKGNLNHPNGNLKFKGNFENGEYDGKGEESFKNCHNFLNLKGTLYYSNGKVEFQGSF